MTDRAEFERLASHVLRYAEHDCKTSTRLGTNEKGETVVSPLDGFGCARQGAHPHFVLIEATTTDAKGLRRKWLSQQSDSGGDEGDLMKAGREAGMLRTTHPDATFKVYLSTNQRVPPSLHSEVIAAAAALGVECDIWEQSRISDFLDIDPTGQYLRAKYFGLAAELLSQELLLEIGQKLLAEYLHHVRLGPEAGGWVVREVEEELRAQVESRETSFVALVGPSGFGKTVLAHRLIRDLLDQGRPALWVSADLAAESHSLMQALRKVMQDHAASLHPWTEQQLATALGQHRMLLVVDDVNRTPSPGMLVKKLVGWSQEAQGIVVACPVWSRSFDSLAYKSDKHVRQVVVGRMSDHEARNVLGFGNEYLAYRLGNDPFLVGLVRNAANTAGGRYQEITAEKVIAEFVARQLSGMQAGSHGASMLCDLSEHRQALERCAEVVLRDFDIEPRLQAVRSTCSGDREQAALFELMQFSGVIWSDARDRICFRHDRVRDHLLGDAMASVLSMGGDTPALGDPFFAEISAAALRARGFPRDHVHKLAIDSPLVLAIALRHVPSDSSHAALILQALKAWWQTELSLRALYPVRFRYESEAAQVEVAGSFNSWQRGLLSWQMIRSEGAWTLTQWLPAGRYELKFIVDGRWRDGRGANRVPDGYGGYNLVLDVNPTERLEHARLSAAARMVVRECAEIDSPIAREVASWFPVHDFDAIVARLRNGDVQAALDFCRLELADPTIRYTVRDAAFEALGRNFGAELEGFFASGLDGAMDEFAILLAGHTRHSRAIHAAFRNWVQAERPAVLVPVLLWAILQDPSSAQQSAVRELIESVVLSKDLMDKSSELLRLSQLRISPDTSEWIVARATKQQELDAATWQLLKKIDTPAALDALVRTCVRLQAKAEERGAVWLGMPLGTDWRRGDAGLPTDTMEHLRGLWSDESQNIGVRRNAFRAWDANSTGREEECVALRTISRESMLYLRSLEARAARRDRSVEIEFAAHLTEFRFGACVGARIWGENLEQAVDRMLGSELSEDALFDIPKLLKFAPPDAARRLLVKHWDKVSRMRAFVEAAVIVGGEVLDELSDRVLETWPIGSSPLEPHPLEHAVMHLELGHPYEQRLDVQKEHILRLLRHSANLDEFDLLRLGELARKKGWAMWGRETIARHMNDETRARVFPSLEVAISELDRILSKDPQGSRDGFDWADRARQHCDDAFDPYDALDAWLYSKTSEAAMTLACEVVEGLGERRGAHLLQKHFSERWKGAARIRDACDWVRRMSLR